MRIYKPEDWMNTVFDTSTIQDEVKENAKAIKARRIGKAKELEENSRRLDLIKEKVQNLGESL